MIHYIVQTIAFQILFLVIYDVFLKKTTFFNWNRVYLLGTVLLSVLLPFIKIDSFKEIISSNYTIALPEVILGGVKPNLELNDFKEVVIYQSISTLEIIFYLGVVVSSFLFLGKLFNLVKLINHNLKTYRNNLVLVKLLKSNASFSFFRYIFLGEYLNSKEQETILKHEFIHVKQWHSLDLMFFEVLRILFWFNPLIYIYHHKITELHEFIADAEAVKHEGKSNYYQSLLSQVFDTQQISFINPFFNQSLIKKRIVMLHKSKSKQVHLLKYGLLVPLILGMLVYTSCADTVESKETNELTSEEVQQENKLIQKTKAVKSLIQRQGNISETEEKGLNLLLQAVKGTELNASLIKEIENFMSQPDQTELTEKISDIFEQIQIQGNVSEQESKALKGLLILTSDNGFNDPFFADVLNDVEIPFGTIDQVPVYPGCEGLETNEEKKACMSKAIQRAVATSFNTKVADSLGLTGRQRINVIFKVNNEGNVVDVRSRAPHPALETEAIRVINTLPKMIPGEQQGKKVNVPYSLPIVFQIQE